MSFGCRRIIGNGVEGSECDFCGFAGLCWLFHWLLRRVSRPVARRRSGGRQELGFGRFCIMKLVTNTAGWMFFGLLLSTNETVSGLWSLFGRLFFVRRMRSAHTGGSFSLCANLLLGCGEPRLGRGTLKPGCCRCSLMSAMFKNATAELTCLCGSFPTAQVPANAPAGSFLSSTTTAVSMWGKSAPAVGSPSSSGLQVTAKPTKAIPSGLSRSFTLPDGIGDTTPLSCRPLSGSGAQQIPSSTPSSPSLCSTTKYGEGKREHCASSSSPFTTPNAGGQKREEQNALFTAAT